MSVTFYVTHAPAVDHADACLCTQDAPLALQTAPALEVAEQLALHADPGCAPCGGCGILTYRGPGEAHVLNLCNGNARAVLSAVGLPPEPLWGELPAGGVPALARTIHEVLVRPGLRRAYLRIPAIRSAVPSSFVVEGTSPPRVVRRRGKPAIHVGGFSDAQMLDRLGRLLALCHEAEALRSGIHWA